MKTLTKLSSSSFSLSPAPSTTSYYSRESDDEADEAHPSLGEKYLSTILRLDKEHNLFGLSNIAIVGSRPSKRMRKDEDKPVFPQTAIVQVLYTGCGCQNCCRYKVGTVPNLIHCYSLKRLITNNILNSKISQVS